jgi:hypothetical protein
MSKRKRKPKKKKFNQKSILKICNVCYKEMLKSEFENHLLKEHNIHYRRLNGGSKGGKELMNGKVTPEKGKPNRNGNAVGETPSEALERVSRERLEKEKQERERIKRKAEIEHRDYWAIKKPYRG